MPLGKIFKKVRKSLGKFTDKLGKVWNRLPGIGKALLIGAAAWGAFSLIGSGAATGAGITEAGVTAGAEAGGALTTEAATAAGAAETAAAATEAATAVGGAGAPTGVLAAEVAAPVTQTALAPAGIAAPGSALPTVAPHTAETITGLGEAAGGVTAGTGTAAGGGVTAGTGAAAGGGLSTAQSILLSQSLQTVGGMFASEQDRPTTRFARPIARPTFSSAGRQRQPVTVSSLANMRNANSR